MKELDLKELLADTGIPAPFMAARMGMSGSSFSNKMNGTKGRSFTPFELEMLHRILHQLAARLSSVHIIEGLFGETEGLMREI